jgi:hypothetical protein
MFIGGRLVIQVKKSVPAYCIFSPLSNHPMYHHLKEIKVLIGDMDIPTHEIVKDFIGAKRYKIESAFTIKGIREKLVREKYHFLLLGDPMPDGNSWEEIDAIKNDHPYLQIWCIAQKLNLKAALEHKKKAFRITPKPLRPDDLNGIAKLLRNLDNHFILIDAGADINNDNFGTIYPTLEEAIIKKEKSKTPKVVVKEWCRGDDDGNYVVYYKERITELPT